MDFDKKLIVLKLVGLILLCVSCWPSELPPKKYVQWLKSNADILSVKKESGSLSFELDYKPIDLMVLRETGLSIKSVEDYYSKKSEYDGLEYFTLKIKGYNEIEQEENPAPDQNSGISPSTNYLSFYMQNDLKMIQNTDTIPCALYHYESGFGVTTDLIFSLGFENKGNKSYEREIIYSGKLTGNEPIKLTISEKNINRIPKLAL